jgi:dTDP-4-dehydrorhamnose reductase
LSYLKSLFNLLVERLSFQRYEIYLMNFSAQRLLLLGANGQLGHQLAVQLQQLGEVKALTRAEADLANPAVLRKALTELAQTFQPTVIVNAAAYTAVDKAQTETELAHAVNAESPAVLAELAKAWNATLVHYSTDYVFDGSGTQPWQESDSTHPLSVYGQSKRDGELAIAAQCPKHLILRTSWVVGAHGGNFLKTMLRLAAERDALRVVADQIGAPTSTELLADVTVQLLQAMHAAADNDARWGIYHLAAAGEVSWHGYAQHVIAGALQRGANLKAKPEAVSPITTADYPVPAPRPLNSRLNTDKLQTTFALTLPAWQVGVDAILDQIISRKSS